MYDQVIDNFRKAGESSLQLQKDLFKQWSGSFYGAPFAPGQWLEQKSTIQKEWSDAITDIARRQKSLLEARFDASVSLLEGALGLAQVSDVKDLKSQTESVFKKSIEKTKELAETELRQAQYAMEKCMSLATKSVT